MIVMPEKWPTSGSLGLAASWADPGRVSHRPIPTTMTPETTPRIGYRRSGGSSEANERLTTPSARTPIVCETVTVSPSPSAWRAFPRDPTRYAAMTVLPCPGETA